MSYWTTLFLARNDVDDADFEKALLEEVKRLDPELLESFQSLLLDRETVRFHFFEHMLLHLSVTFDKKLLIVIGAGECVEDLWVRRYAAGKIYVRSLKDEWRPVEPADEEKRYKTQAAFDWLGIPKDARRLDHSKQVRRKENALLRIYRQSALRSREAAQAAAKRAEELRALYSALENPE